LVERPTEMNPAIVVAAFLLASIYAAMRLAGKDKEHYPSVTYTTLPSQIAKRIQQDRAAAFRDPVVILGSVHYVRLFLFFGSAIVVALAGHWPG
jgi:hypothetical protein